MTPRTPVAVTAIGWEIPGWETAQSILEIVREPVRYGDFEPQRLLGKRGLRYKDRATLLAMCAVHKALQHRGLLDVAPERRASIGVCVSSNLGNMDTVCLESEIICRQHVDQTSPMNLPVASSNVIPASIAIRFGFKAINLMLCNGATSGVDAVNLAAQMVRSGRAEKMVVVGVEPRNPITERLLGECNPDRIVADVVPGDLAACVILEAAENRDVASYGTIGTYEFLPPDGNWSAPTEVPDVWFVPALNTPRSRELLITAGNDSFQDVPLVDVSGHTGELYGALGVLQVAAAAAYLRDRREHCALISNGFSFGDGLSSIYLHA